MIRLRVIPREAKREPPYAYFRYSLLAMTS
jgi:hypothetical protein